MSQVWVVCPSARPPVEVEKWAKAWREQGYKIALWRDTDDGLAALQDKALGVYIVDVPQGFLYPGYAQVVNHLIRGVMYGHADAEWFVVAGDDIYPDTTKTADEIAHECSEHFFEGNLKPEDARHLTFDEKTMRLSGANWLDTFGVMQPTGDRFGDDATSRRMFGEDRGAYADRVCGSAWIGREFARRMYQGNGPLWPEYRHMFVDEELQQVAIKYGVLWQRRDLTQRHEHWSRAEGVTPQDCPAFLKEATSQEHWKKYKTIFENRKVQGFPGSEPL